MLILTDGGMQGELEHRSPKAWHRRTDRKNFVQQMTQMERRQARIRRIKHRLSSTRAQAEHVAAESEAHYHIGVSQNRHKHIGTFLRFHEGDPAINVGILFTYIKCNSFAFRISYPI